MEKKIVRDIEIDNEKVLAFGEKKEYGIIYSKSKSGKNDFKIKLLF